MTFSRRCIVSLQPHNALDFGDRQDRRLVNAEAAKGALEMLHLSSLILQMGSPERVGAFPKGLVHLVATSGFKPRSRHSPSNALPKNCVVMEGATGQDPREAFMASSISRRISSSGCMAGVRVRAQGTGMARFQGRVALASVHHAGSFWTAQHLGGPFGNPALGTGKEQSWGLSALRVINTKRRSSAYLPSTTCQGLY